jgi:DNA-binding SARP family transcriptional activator
VAFRYSLLGPVRVWHDGRELDPGSPQQCAVLALLLLAGGRPVATEQLVEKLWGPSGPAAARATARTYVSRLRHLLPSGEPRSVIQSGRGGYVLPVEADALDLSVFVEQLRVSREARDRGDPHRAVRYLHDALALWQGTALAGARGEYVTGERDRLERLRLIATEERIALDIELGRHVDVLPEISSLASLHPFEERLRELQMLALYRCARQVDALRVYREVRALLNQELGIEPGPELRALHQRILRADPKLEGPPSSMTISRSAPAQSAAPAPNNTPEPSNAPARAAEPAARCGLLAGRLQAARERSFVGREAERALFASALTGDEPTFAALFLHGVGGIGKSTLLRRFADDAKAAGRSVVRVDGQVVEASAAAFGDAAKGALNNPNTVLLVDTFERCAELEPWLREDFLPRLADGVVVALAGRRPPSPAWRADPSWSETLRVRALGSLSRPEASALLDVRGVPAQIRESVLAWVGGHPLALSLAAEVAQRGDSAARTWLPTLDVIQTLLTELIGTVPSQSHRLALHVCAHAYTTTEELLRAVIPDADSAELFDWLRDQPFIEAGPNGLYPHDILRDVLNSDLCWRDPATYETIHRRVRAYWKVTGTPRGEERPWRRSERFATSCLGMPVSRSSSAPRAAIERIKVEETTGRRR